MTIKRFVPRRSNMQKRLREIEEMRASLPLGKYLQLIHIGATTGVIPFVHPLTGDISDIAVTTVHDSEDEPKQVLLLGSGSVLEPDKRMALLQYLINKQLADPTLVQLEAASQTSEKISAEVVENPADTNHLQRADLEQIISDAEFYVPKPSDPVLPSDEEMTG